MAAVGAASFALTQPWDWETWACFAIAAVLFGRLAVPAALFPERGERQDEVLRFLRETLQEPSRETDRRA